jgi:hypothetical protein
MKLKLHNVIRTFKRLNTMAFNGSLPMIEIKLINHEGAGFWAIFITNRKGRNYILLNEAMFELYPVPYSTILIHEMVHFEQYLKGRELSHDSSFMRRLSIVEKRANLRYFRNFDRS